MRQGHEIGKSVRAGMEDKQPKLLSVFDATADIQFPSQASNTHEVISISIVSTIPQLTKIYVYNYKRMQSV